ncbi:MAG: zinc-dependent peptidase [Bacteroidales bacterium]|nr:zinc-dependent peptidase [Bacteroidales bacterium]
MYEKIFIVIFIILIIILIRYIKRKNAWKTPKDEFLSNWRIILSEKVIFYNNLNEEEKKRFEYKIQEFLLNCKITGIKTTVDDTDRLLVAASAIIPIFEFPEWKYLNIDEVLLYPVSFDTNFDMSSSSSVLGMVGSGYMEGKMILSKSSLQHGFRNETDKKNTAIHEFVHLIDKADGAIDGVPELLLAKQYTIPWLDLIKKKIDEIYEGSSDINPYGATDKTEFFAVISEYFFERPKLLKTKHPELYKMLEKIFKTDGISRFKIKKRNIIGRNSSCPCGSGKKYKYCCGKYL